MTELEGIRWIEFHFRVLRLVILLGVLRIIVILNKLNEKLEAEVYSSKQEAVKKE